jgi:tetratricopeptide (TPR) repeat protein
MRNAIRYRPTVPPSRPPIFYGRDDLVAELTDLVINDDHIALIGAGGMGKSSLAKAILNEPLVADKFADRRFFVTYDGLDPSTITFEAFMSRFAETLGIEQVGADPMRQISTFLRSPRALVVLDNAETFEEASGSPSLDKIPSAIAEIASIPGVVLILTSRSRRNAPDVAWVTKDVPALDPNSAQDVFFRIYGGAGRIHAEEEINDLLEALEFHPLSIGILANAARQNSWSPAILLKRWNDRRSKLLDLGKGKLQSLSFTMQLSLSSPSIQDLGEDGLRALAVIAFLPQGLNDNLASDLLPSIPHIDTICDVLCMQSLAYRQGGFVKMLAPIRHYVRDSLPPPDLKCLGDIHAFYYFAVRRCAERRDDSLVDIVISDHLNIERMVAFGLGRVLDGEQDIYELCWKFLHCLQYHLPRPTILTPAIFNIIENPFTWMPKARCLQYLGNLYRGLSQLAEGIKAFQAAEGLYVNAGAHDEVAWCVVACGDVYKSQGRFIQSTHILQHFQHSDSWKHLRNAMKAQVLLYLDIARMYTFIIPADELFVTFVGDHTYDLGFKIGHWRAKLFYGGDIAQVKTHLDDILLHCTRTGNFYYPRHALRALAEAAYCEGNLSETMDILEKLLEYYEGHNPESVLWYTVWKAVVASDQGNYDLARVLIQKSSGPLEFLALPNARTFIHRTYSSAHIELVASEYGRAESLFTVAIEGCDTQGDLRVKAYCIRGLGEVACVHGNFALAGQRFAEARALCNEMGVPPQKLYSFAPFDGLPERFEGWVLFLEGRSPFAKCTSNLS